MELSDSTTSRRSLTRHILARELAYFAQRSFRNETTSTTSSGFRVRHTSGSSIWSRGGGTRNVFRDFADVAPLSQASEASQYWLGSRACLRALEALAFLTIKYAFSHFSWYFFFKFLMYICIGTLLNIYFNMRDSGDFDKCNFWSLYLRKSRVLVVHLV